MIYTVEIHGSDYYDNFELVLATSDEEKARERYKLECLDEDNLMVRLDYWTVDGEKVGLEFHS